MHRDCIEPLESRIVSVGLPDGSHSACNYLGCDQKGVGPGVQDSVEAQAHPPVLTVGVVHLKTMERKPDFDQKESSEHGEGALWF